MQTIPISFVLEAGQTHAIIGYRVLGSSAPYTIVEPFPTVSPYNLTVPDGVYDIFVQPTCNQVFGAVKSLLSVVGGAAATCTKPSFVFIVERSGIVEGGITKRVIDVTISIPANVQKVVWYIDDVETRESTNNTERFIIDDENWDIENIKFGIKSVCSPTSSSIVVEQTVSMTQPDPNAISCPVPGLTIYNVQLDSFTVNFNLAAPAEGVAVGNVRLSYKTDLENAYTQVVIPVAELPKVINGLNADTIYSVFGEAECTTAEETVWSGATAVQRILTNSVEQPGNNDDDTLQPPPFLIVDPVTANGATFTWDAMPDATSYMLMLIRLSDNTATEYPVAGTTTTINGLIAAATYDAKIKAIYDVNQSPYGDTVRFTTSPGGGGGGGDI